MSSTESLAKPDQPIAAKWATALGKIHLLGKLIGAESIRRGLGFEDDLARRDAEAYHKLLHGERAGDSAVDDMGDIILGDRIENHQSPPQQPASSGGFAKALLGAGLLATGIGGPVGAWMIADAIRSKPTPAPVEQVQPETKTETKVIDWTVGEPIVE